VKEIARVTKHNGTILVMLLNPKSEYFREEIKKPGDYFKRIKQTNLKEIRDPYPQTLEFFVSRGYSKKLSFMCSRSDNLHNYCVALRHHALHTKLNIWKSHVPSSSALMRLFLVYSLIKPR